MLETGSVFRISLSHCTTAAVAATTSSELLPSRLNATFTNPGEKRGKEQKSRRKEGAKDGKKTEESKRETAVKLTIN